MRLLLLIDSLYPGGAQRQIIGLAELLVGKGYEVKLADYWGHDFYDKYLTEIGIEFEHRVAKGKFNIFKSIYSLIRDYRPDTVICYLEHSSAIACIVKLLHLTHPFKLIVSERNTTQQLHRADRIRFNLFQLAADEVVPNSYSQTEFINSHFPGLSKKITTITNYLDTNRFIPGKKTLAKNQTSEKLQFIIVGRVVEQKNPLRLIRAIAKVRKMRPEDQFVVNWYGQPHPKDYFDICLALRHELNLDDTICFHPATQDIITEYQNSDVFILPSIYEGFPNVLCEAMSCGLPVMASAVCDNPSILENGENGILFNPLSVDDMAEKIVKILDMSRQQLTEMGGISRKIAVDKFSPGKFINAYISLIEK